MVVPRLLAAAAAVAAAGAAALPLAPPLALPVAPDLEALGWVEMAFDGKRQNRFVGHTDGRLEVTSRASVSSISRPVAADPATTPVLAWSWRVEEAPPPTDLARRGGDDRALAVYVAFAWDGASATLWEWLMRPLVVARRGAAAPGRALAYTWGGTAPRGARLASPYMQDAGRIVVLRPGDAPLGRWLGERVDLAADYATAFGGAAPALVEIGIVADTDDTGSRARAFVRDLRLEAAAQEQGFSPGSNTPSRRGSPAARGR